MTIKEEIKSILNRLIDDGEEDRQGGASAVAVFNLDKLMRSYHKEKAAAINLATSGGGWFMNLGSKQPEVQRQRDAVEVLVDIARSKNTQFIIASESLCDLYQNALGELRTEVSA